MEKPRILSQIEINDLPIILEFEKDGIFEYGGFILDSKGVVVGKTPFFEYKDYINYFDSYPTTNAERFIIPINNKFNIISWSELKGRKFEDSEWRIQGLVPKHGLTILAGVSGEKKTWLGLHMAYSIATGTHLFGSDKFSTMKGKVLWIDAEMGPRELQRRGMLLEFDNIEKDKIEIMTGDSARLGSDEDFESLAELVDENQVNVVVVDTLRGVADGLNEDKAEEVRRFLQRFNPLKDRGVTIIMIDHCRKPIRNEGYAPKKEQLLGSTDKVASAESVIMLKSEQNSPAFAVYHVKNRTGTELKPFMVIMKDTDDPKRVTFTFDGEFDEETSKMDTAKVVIPQIIGSASMTTKQLVDVMRKEQKVGERYTREALKQLVINEQLTIEKVGKENSYKITDIGLLLK